MKYVEAMIRPSKYVETKEKLAEKGYYSAIVLDVIGRGKGDGKIFISDLENAIRISTGVQGEDAIV